MIDNRTVNSVSKSGEKEKSSRKKKHKKHKSKDISPEHTDLNLDFNLAGSNLPVIHARADYGSNAAETIDWRYCRTPSDCQGESPELTDAL